MFFFFVKKTKKKKYFARTPRITYLGFPAPPTQPPYLSIIGHFEDTNIIVVKGKESAKEKERSKRKDSSQS